MEGSNRAEHGEVGGDRMRQQLVIPHAWKFSRAGGIDPNPANVISRAGTFASAAPDGTVLVTRREPEGLRHYMFAPDTARVSDAAINLAHTVGARLESLDDAPDVFASRHMVVARHKKNSGVGRETQAGFELGEVSLRLATILKEGEWVAAVMREPHEREKRWHATWLAHHTGGRQQHHSGAQNAVIMSLWAGSSSVSGGKSVLEQTVAALPGFDLSIQPVAVTTVTKGAAVIGAAVAVAALTITAFMTGLLDGHQQAQMVGGFVLGGVIPAIVGGALYIAGRVPSYAEKVKRFARFNRLLFARANRFWFKKPSRERSGKDGALIPGSDGTYPLHQFAYLVGPHLPASLIAPQAGAESGTASTAHRVAPAIMTERIGPIIGENNGRPVCLSAADGWSGLIAFGQAGSGKSHLIQALWAWTSLERVSPSGLRGWPGRSNAMIAFESKGDGADAYEDWSRVTGDRALKVEFAGHGDIQLDILNVPGDAERKARALTNAMKYAFSDGSIQERSFKTLVQVFTAAFAMTPELAAAASLPYMSPVGYANILIGNTGDQAGVDLAGVIRSEAVRVNAGADTDLGKAASMLGELYEGASKSARQGLQQAPASKIAQLFAGEHYWVRPKRLTWDQVVQNHLAVIVNTGSTKGGETEDDELTGVMSAMMMYSLYEAIKRNCIGWWDAGRWVSIFADELKLLAGSSETVITWLRDQGRGYGVRLNFATQYPEQLSQPVRNAVMGFGTLLAFVQSNPDVVANLVRDLSLSDDKWVNSDVANLPAYEAIVRASANQQRQTPFTVKLTNWAALKPQFAQIQGYAAADPTPTGAQW